MEDNQKNIEMSRTGFVEEHMERALNVSLANHRSTLLAGLRSNLLYVPLESPLEMAFLGWWCVLAEDYDFWPEVHIRPQAEVSLQGIPYRVDFVLEPTYRDKYMLVKGCLETGAVCPLFAVELDGHEFHERTKDQVAWRNRRDRLLQAHGWTVLHFSGSEFHRRPEECVMEAYNAAMAGFWKTKHEISALRRLKLSPEERTDLETSESLEIQRISSSV